MNLGRLSITNIRESSDLQRKNKNQKVSVLMKYHDLPLGSYDERDHKNTDFVVKM